MTGDVQEAAVVGLGPGRADIDQSARTLLAFFERNRTDPIIETRCLWRFPKQACQKASLILAYLLEEKYGLTGVRVIKGYDARYVDLHFWVVVGDLIYDLTAHQFDGCEPVIGELTTPMHGLFPNQEDEVATDCADREYILWAFREGVIPF